MNSSYIIEILGKILVLQRQDFDEDIVGCDRPFLGPNNNTCAYNTRPVQLFNAYTATPWEFSYTLDGVSGTTNIFRVESMEQGTVTVRLLASNSESTYVNTNQFVTIDTSTIGAIRCLPDTYVSL